MADEQRVAFIRDHYGERMARNMRSFFFDRDPDDDAERGFLASIRRSIDREMADSGPQSKEGE